MNCVPPRRLALPLALLFLAVSAPGAAQTLPSVDEVADRVLEAYGGVDRVRETVAIRAEGTIVTAAGREGSVVRISQGTDGLMSMVHYPDRVELRILEGGMGWRGAAPVSLEPVEGPLKASMEMQALRIMAIWVLDAYRGSTTLSPSEEVMIAEISLEGGRSLNLAIDPETYLVRETASMLPAGPMTLIFTTSYSDFRVVSDLLIPHHEESTAQGQPTAVIQLTSVELNPEGDRLKLPAGG